MPKIDLTITISVVIAICAIISPVITTLLNNHHALKMKKLEMKLTEQEKSTLYKRGIYENYLRLTSQCIMHPSAQNLADYGNIYPMALIYFPEELISELNELNTQIAKHEMNNCREMFDKLAPKIRTILKTQ